MMSVIGLVSCDRRRAGHPALQSHAVALAYRHFATEFAFEFVRQRERLGQGVVPGANVDDGK